MNLLAALASVRIFPGKASHQTLTTRWGKALDPQHILEEYPRPQMIRDQYINLYGEWNYTVLSEKNTITKEGTLLFPNTINGRNLSDPGASCILVQSISMRKFW